MLARTTPNSAAGRRVDASGRREEATRGRKRAARGGGVQREDASRRREEVSGHRRGCRVVVPIAAEAAPADNEKVSRLGQIRARVGESIRGPRRCAPLHPPTLRLAQKENYINEIEAMQYMSKHEVVASLRRKSSGFARGASIYRGVARHHQNGRWQARIGHVAGNKDLYLGTFATEAEAAEAYDIAALKFRGAMAVTNFEPSRYNLEAIIKDDLWQNPLKYKAFHESIEVESYI